MPGREKQGFSSQCTPPTHRSDYDAHQTPAPGFLGAKFMTMFDLSACGVGDAVIVKPGPSDRAGDRYDRSSVSRWRKLPAVAIQHLIGSTLPRG